MHLKQLKLVGFKSFVEPTTVPFSSPLVAVVGPNGCGKSNIIDAVRWVMGERSAKHLRGESMADVIFNGSSNRKAVGQASVELVFDNRLGRLTGPYASYQEIAVKRVITREGVSSYYLNGARCRRRDVMDIFLGTGAGARGYSIIGQGTISRLVEAHPDELRVYLEEAAGISKYKERRRETLQRITHTRENLARVADIRDELQKQLQRLERQAKIAEQYKALKHAEHQGKGNLLALKWRLLKAEHERVHQAITEQSLTLEAHQSRLAEALNEGALLREAVSTAEDAIQYDQLNCYQLNTDIVRLQESIEQRRREQQRLNTEKTRLEEELETVKHQLEKDKASSFASDEVLTVLTSQMELRQREWNDQQQCLQHELLKKKEWDAQRQHLQTLLNEAERHVERGQMTRRHLEERRQYMQARIDDMNAEQLHLVVESLHADCLLLKAQQTNLVVALQDNERLYQHQVEQGKRLREEQLTIEQQRLDAQDTVQRLRTENAVLFAAQNAALQKPKQSGHAFLEQKKHACLVDLMGVPPPWVRACELVFGESLYAIVLESMDELWPSLLPLQGSGTAFLQRKSSPSVENSRYPRLIDYLSGATPCWFRAFEHVFAATSMDEALLWLPTLASHESVVSMDGYWFGPGWALIDSVTVESTAGVLHRKQALLALGEALAVEEARLSELTARRDALHRQWVDHEQAAEEYLRLLSLSRDEVREGEASLSRKEQAYTDASTRMHLFMEEQEVLQRTLEEMVTAILVAEEQDQTAVNAVAMHTKALQQCMTEKENWDASLAALQQAVEEARTLAHQMALQCNHDTLKAQQWHDTIKREEAQIEALHERLDALLLHESEWSLPDEASHQSLDEKIRAREQIEAGLIEKRQDLDKIKERLMVCLSTEKEETQHLASLRESIQEKQLKAQTLMAHLSNVSESLVDMEMVMDVLLASLPSDATIEGCEKDWLLVQEKIKRLGAVNLLAIEEYQTDLERKDYLEAQYQDLMTALTTLDVAITKMDKETERRLKETFDEVNASFQSLFPRLFGGGRARLELTCDNLLEAGVLVMAEPPGKRNSTIHLLSGGEKAMTAVALVFAIFQLNPSPFCMLDEVDAPLDDLNVQRFCDLVREMSQVVQFLFITHNKVTMELANHLIGVTMSEPGVSRVVAVDVEEALALAK